MKRVMILGVTGQDGTLLAAQLRKQSDSEILGLNRQGVVDADRRLLRSGKITDAGFIRDVVQSFAPTHIFYLAAHHHSSADTGLDRDANLWQASLDVQVLGLVHVLEAAAEERERVRLFYASSSHVFGAPEQSPQNEETWRQPTNVYGITKMTGMEVCRHYREERGFFASCGILYNHESALRQDKFLSRKIILAARAIKQGRTEPLILGDLSSEVDWGYASDYVDAMVRILDLPNAGDYVVATGEVHTVREFVETAFALQGLDYRLWVREDRSIIRPQRGRLIGDAGKLRRETGWAPRVSFEELVRLLMLETEP